MKIMRIRTFFLSVFFSVSATLSWGQTWKLTETMTAVLSNGVLTISTTANSEAMPDYSSNYGASWYGVRSNIRSVIIENNVTSIGKNCFFECSNLITVTIPNSVTTIGDFTFWGCSALTSISMPNVATIGQGAFNNCTALTSVTIPNVTTIKSSFQGCSALTSLSMPNVITIEGAAFIDCSSLTSVSMPNVTTIGGGGAFSNCISLTSVNMPNVTTLGYHAFNGCSTLSFVSLPKVTEIENYTFYKCSALTSVSMPNVTTIEQHAFDGCSAITSLTMSNVKTIENHAFLYCSALISVSMPNVTTIGEFAFSGCIATTSVTMPNVEMIGRYAFLDCSSLASVTMPNVVTIGVWAFVRCFSLTSLTIPKSVTFIGDEAFRDCTGLKNVIVTWETPLSVGNMFSWVNTSAITLHVPPGTKALYEGVSPWRNFGTIKETGVIPEVTQPASGNGNGNGNISLNLYVPNDVTLTGSFEIQFPDGINLDKEATALAFELSGNLYLLFTFIGNNTWLIEIKSNGLKSSSVSEYRKIMDIAYKAVETVNTGTYEATIKSLDFTMNDGTSIHEDLLTVAIPINQNATYVEKIRNTPISANFNSNRLKIESPQAELVTIYSIMGAQLYSVEKNEGVIEIPFPSQNGSIFIIKGSKSGTLKIAKQN